METPAATALILLAALCIFWLAVRLPPRRAVFDKAKPSKSFHGLILFGKHGAFVMLHKHASGDRISFRKEYSDEEHWRLRVTIVGPGAQATLIDQIQSAASIYGTSLRIDAPSRAECGELELLIHGAMVTDHAALEGFARLIVDKLGHSRTDKYRVTFGGPKDYQKVSAYFGFKTKDQ